MAKSVLIRIAGVVIFLLGLGLSGWLAYNMYVEAQPEYAKTATSDRSSAKAIVIGIVMMAIGVGMVLPSKKDPNGTPPQPPPLPPDRT